MSKQRQRARAAREAAQESAKAAAARTAARRVKASQTASQAAAQRGSRRSAREPVYRLRRFPRLPWRLKAALVLGWLAVAVLVLVTVSSWTARLGLLVVATAVLPLIVVIVRDPSRRTR